MPLLARSSETLREWAPLPIRLIVGYGFMAHGFAKLTVDRTPSLWCSRRLVFRCRYSEHG